MNKPFIAGVCIVFTSGLASHSFQHGHIWHGLIFGILAGVSLFLFVTAKD